MTQRDSLRLGNTTIEYEVRRSRRRKKTVQITVGGDGVQVAAPSTTLDADVRAIVRRRAPWILTHSTAATLEAAPKQLVSGETLPYLGRNVRLVVEPGPGPVAAVRFDHWRLHVVASHALGGDARRNSIRRALVRWYRVRAAARLRARIRFWWPRLGSGNPPPSLVRDQRQRWASCAPDGTLRFNWRIVMAEPALLDYVVAHELAHLSLRTHSRQFWARLAHVMPDYQARRRRLKEFGRQIPF